MLTELLIVEVLLIGVLLFFRRGTAMMQVFSWPWGYAVFAFAVSLVFLPDVYASAEWKRNFLWVRIALYALFGFAYYLGHVRRRTKLEWLICAALIASVQLLAETLVSRL